MGVISRSRRLGLVLVLVLVAAGCDWLQWGGGPHHPGGNFEPSITSASVPNLLVTQLADLDPSTPAVIASGLVLIADDETLTAYDSASGAVVWTGTLPAGTTVGSAPAVDAGAKTVFLVSATATGPQLVGFDLDGRRNCSPWDFTCKPIFRADLGAATGPATPPVVADGKVFVNGTDALHAFAADAGTNCTVVGATATCTPVWSAPTGFSTPGIGPAVSQSIVFSALDTGSGVGIGAFRAADGQALWSGATTGTVTASPSIAGDLRVVVPAGDRLDVFAGGGCGNPICAPQYGLVPRPGDPAGSFLAMPAIDGGRIHATNSNGLLSTWPLPACGAATCEPGAAVAVDTPGSVGTEFAQSPVVANGIVFVLGRQPVEGVDHTFLLARAATDGAAVAGWDLGTAGFGGGLVGPSVAWGVVYAPTADALHAARPSTIAPLASLTTAPLTLSPQFSPTIADYTLLCAAGTNAVDLTASAVPGGSVRLVAPVTTAGAPSLATTVSLVENQAAVLETRDAQSRLRQYWIRCLPADFPPLSALRYPEAGEATPGWYLVGNNFRTAGYGSFVIIADGNGTPVWYRRVATGPTNVTYLGPNRLGWFAANRFDVHTLTTGTTQSVAMVGKPTDQHELTPLPNGGWLLMSYNNRSGVDLTGLPNASPTPGSNETITDCTLQEVGPSGELVWEWSASDHVDPVAENTLPASSVTGGGTRLWDLFHCNSIDVNPANGNVLVSARNMNAVFEIDRSTGLIVWKMGGKPTNRDGAAIVAVQNDPLGSFVMQHDARYLADGVIGLYDNRTSGQPPARAMEYRVDLDTLTAEPVFSYPFPNGDAACCMGSFRRNPDGHRVVGWGVILGNNKVLTELDQEGERVLDLVFAGNNGSYRAVKVPPSRFDVTTMRRTAGQG